MIQASWAGSEDGPSRVDEPAQAPDELAPGRAVINPQQEVGADVGRRSLVQRAALDVVELEAHGIRGGHGGQWCSGGSGGSGFGGARYGNVLRGRLRGVVDPVADDGPVASVDERREDRVHHVVVGRPASAGLVRLTAERGELDLEERAVLGIGLADVDDEVVGEHQLGQRMAAVVTRRPVGLPVEPVPEREVRVQPRAVRAEIAAREVERVLHVVEVADLEVPVHRIELLRRQHEVLDLGSPDALDPDVELAARERLGDDADQRRTAQERGCRSRPRG